MYNDLFSLVLNVLLSERDLVESMISHKSVDRYGVVLWWKVYSGKFEPRNNS